MRFGEFVKLSFLGLAIIGGLAVATPASAWETPARGTKLRADLMDAVRPHAYQIFGAPVVFVIEELRVQGDVAFAMLDPVRPDGRKMVFDDLSPEIKKHEDPEYWAGPHMQALYQRVGRTWVASYAYHGATDVWWADPRYCPTWHSVIPEYCSN